MVKLAVSDLFGFQSLGDFMCCVFEKGFLCWLGRQGDTNGNS